MLRFSCEDSVLCPIHPADHPSRFQTNPETIDTFTRTQTPAGLNAFGYGWDVFRGGDFCPKPGLPEGKFAIGHTGYTGTFV